MQAGLAKFAPEGGVIEEAGEGTAGCMCIVDFDEQPRLVMAHDFGERTDPGGHDRHGGGHGLQDGKAAGLLPDGELGKNVVA